MSEHPPAKAWGALDEIFSSGRPLAYVRTAEEGRVVSLLRAAAAGAFPSPVPLWVWSLTEGMRRDGSPDQPEPLGPREALDFVARHDGPGVFLLKDFHEQIRDAPEIRRRLRDLYEACVDRGKFVIVCAPVNELPDELAHQVMLIDLPMPGLDELTVFARAEAATVVAAGGTADTSDGTLRQVARALQGLTLDEAHHAVRRARSVRNALDAQSLPALLEEKRALVNRTGIVEFLPSVTGIDDIGGLDIMKKWLLDRRKLFQMRDELSAEIVPKGVLVMGVSGR